MPDAARLLGLSVRHVRRLLAKAGQRGLAAIAHWQPRPSGDVTRQDLILEEI